MTQAASSAYDVLIAGGGVMGCATAYYLLKAAPQLKVAIIEKDATYSRASTTLSDGNTRLQFNLRENIAMSQYGLEVLDTFAEEMAVDGEKPDVAFRRQGNLFVVDEAGYEESMQGLTLQQQMGADVRWLTPAQIEAIYPLYNLADCVGGTFGPHDGTMAPLAVLLAYKKKSIALGAHFVEAEVAAVLRQHDAVTGVQLTTGETLSAPVVVNGAGPWAAALAATAQVTLPVVPVKRQVTIIEVATRPRAILPAIFFPSGLYLFHEGEGVFTCGKSLPQDPETLTDFAWERAYFEDHFWPELVDLLPSFDRLKINSGWAGLYEMNSFDGNAILGEWPELRGFYLANGFSGHGFQQCHAVGRYLSELILGQTPALDLSLFSPQRILHNKPAFESVRKLI